MIRLPWASIAPVALALGGCINAETRLYEVELDGQVEVAGGAPSTGAVHLQFHVARTFGPGELSHPLGEFDRRTSPATGPVRVTLLYPLDVGEGLVVYGWLDADGDGLHCAPGQTDEPAGLVEVSGFPAHALPFTLTLSTPCVGPEMLYP